MAVRQEDGCGRQPDHCPHYHYVERDGVIVKELKPEQQITHLSVDRVDPSTAERLVRLMEAFKGKKK